jgi:hypothetical protein
MGADKKKKVWDGLVGPCARGTEEGMEPDDLLCSRNARPPKGRRKGVRAFFAPGARALRRASLDGRSQKLLTPLLGWH